MKSTMLLLVVLFLCCFSAFGKSGFENSSVLNSSVPQFVDAVISAIDLVERAISSVSGSNGIGLSDDSELEGSSNFDFRSEIAVSDCLELMESSVDQLNSTIYAIQNRTGNSLASNVTGSLSGDMKTWLSAALINQETCKDGSNGTNASINVKLLDQITSLVQGILANITTTNSSRSKPSLPHPHLFPLPTRLMADVVVSPDGSGNFTNITEAINNAPNHSTTRYIIHVKKGVYNEYVEIGKEKCNITIIGDGMNNTIIRGNRSVVDGWTTFRSATFAAKGKGFTAIDVAFENTAGPEKHQAVAFRSDSDLSVLYRCAFVGYQDTLYAHSMRQFYRECFITGTVDFVFGDALAVFQNCSIVARTGLPNQKNVVTANGRKEAVEVTGFTFQFCNISVEPQAINSSIVTFLGRPWKEYSRTVIMQSYIGQGISPRGWLEWNVNQSLDTLYYAEYLNTGPGAGLGNRVGWPGYHVLNTTLDANNFTVSRFIFGDTWLPPTGVNYIAGLTV